MCIRDSNNPLRTPKRILQNPRKETTPPKRQVEPKLSPKRTKNASIGESHQGERSSSGSQESIFLFYLIDECLEHQVQFDTRKSCLLYTSPSPRDS
eukprot:TRINITY_DN21359_c0_g1_i1.p1 TRINITY_DN21359_c0_g1~~TRINITY_DN21359_c0_g1_i1.p1  ORF type:complete len:108 (-),score=15.67 TRINITY_DN21359_c0_g1_i1:16-303(-)